MLKSFLLVLTEELVTCYEDSSMLKKFTQFFAIEKNGKFPREMAKINEAAFYSDVVLSKCCLNFVHYNYYYSNINVVFIFIVR